MPRQALSLNTLVNQVNNYAPNRDKASDGGIGDAAHSARSSDHNPDSRGIWHARDITNDTTDNPNLSGDLLPGQMLADALVRGRDYRIKYIIWNHRIWYPSSGWQAYNGPNPHTHHVHVSVNNRGEDDTSQWKLDFSRNAGPVPNCVPALQRAVRLLPDGIWGPNTDGAINLVHDATQGKFTNVANLQRVVGTEPDGVWGPKSKQALINTVKAIQAALGVEQAGVWGPKTEKAWSAARNSYFRK